MEDSLGPESGLAAVVNNAGIAIAGPLEFLPTEKFRQTLEVNVIGQVSVIQACLPLLRAGKGRVIQVSSGSRNLAMPFLGSYVASKAAVIGMTRGMARELGRDRIRVNAVAPSAVMTEGTREFFGEKFEKAKTVIAADQVIQRNLEPEDLTGTIVYLASDNSALITGQTHMVDGGSWFL